MTNERFAALVGHLEGLARARPGAYRLRVIALAMLGNAYLALMLALLAGLLVLTLAAVVVLKFLALKLALVLGFFTWAMFKSMRVHLEPPAGRPVSASDCPELFEMIEALRRALGAPRFHHVLITDDFNAGVMQVPRFGFFGGNRNYLVIGLPMMKSLTVEQLRAVLAHEFGHLAGGHGRMSNWVYRQRRRWSQLLAQLDAQGGGGFLFRPFLRRFGPYFDAYSFPLARANEYEADAASARLTSPATAAEALTGTHVVASYLQERFWPAVHKQADEAPQPAGGPYAAMGREFASGIEGEAAQRWIEQSMALETGLDDTHPSLQDRLAALGMGPRFAPPADGAASDTLLGPLLPRVTDAFDEQWNTAIQDAWRQRYEEVRQGRGRLAELDARGESLTLEEAWERAQLTESFGTGEAAALELFRDVQRRAPDVALYNYELGTRLLGRDDDEGIALVERAIALSDDAIAPGARALRDYHWRHGRQDAAHQWHVRYAERTEALEKARAERGAIRINDRFEPHGLDAACVAALRAQLIAVGQVRRAWLVRKRLVHAPENPLYVLGFRTTRWFAMHREKRAREVQERIVAGVRFPGETLVLCVEAANERFGRKLRWRRGARVV